MKSFSLLHWHQIMGSCTFPVGAFFPSIDVLQFQPKNHMYHQRQASDIDVLQSLLLSIIFIIVFLELEQLVRQIRVAHR